MVTQKHVAYKPEKKWSVFMSKSSDKPYICAALTPLTITWIVGLESDTSQLCSFILQRLTGVDIIVQTVSQTQCISYISFIHSKARVLL